MPAVNAMRGEAPLGPHRVVVDFNALCALERKTGYRVPQLLEMAESGLGFDELRTWVHVMIDAADMSVEEVGELIGNEGYEAASLAIGTALEGFFPAAKTESGDTDPQPAE